MGWSHAFHKAKAVGAGKWIGPAVPGLSSLQTPQPNPFKVIMTIQMYVTTLDREVIPKHVITDHSSNVMHISVISNLRSFSRKRLCARITPCFTAHYGSQSASSQHTKPRPWCFGSSVLTRNGKVEPRQAVPYLGTGTEILLQKHARHKINYICHPTDRQAPGIRGQIGTRLIGQSGETKITRLKYSVFAAECCFVNRRAKEWGTRFCPRAYCAMDGRNGDMPSCSASCDSEL
ncbi:hypothetical protein PAAG_12612 [Paracoccidioides lutzii Pb01]|uniref:Uncharacterized protein n=1 Tax=Paracoccidioides lutzii (strain ATCC MYA-826 / Pb01) TaxID=502779 RepID=A0A0A2V3L9_PARBA|nr:hypothetical protein PAAG_12612 [Paracoccidioides lutzii Pb01]KGQ00720.1 hypothetical protein PAAG_12612 [Paracoccidioides lutzii Pb01]